MEMGTNPIVVAMAPALGSGGLQDRVRGNVGRRTGLRIHAYRRNVSVAQ